MPTYYDHGLGLDDPTQITESGDELASAANYIEPENVDYAQYTWENQPISEYVTRLVKNEDFPQLSSSLIYITIPSGSPHNIYDSTNTVLVSGNAQENNDRDFTLDYTLRGATTDTGNLAEDNVWSFTTAALDFGNTEVVVGINSDIGIRDTDNVIISRTPTLSPVITVTTPTTAPTATTIYDTMGIGGTAVDPNSLPIQRVDYTATASGDTEYTQYFGLTYWACLANCTWDGDSYNESGPGMSIVPVTGSWYIGFRPDYIRVTVDSSYTFNLRDNTGANVVNLPVTPGVNTLPITWQGNDLGPSESPSYLGRISNASGEISNIEFGSAGVGTDESAKATGTDNWSFTVPLILGDTTVDVTGSNTYSLSGSDSIVVTRTTPLNPVVTITTETSVTTASEITIDGTASDPNGLNIVTVSYELSGARTDSGIATGTTIWTFTEGLSAGNNRFDVTAINDWTPPLSGSDSLIVTYNPPAEGGGPEADCTGAVYSDEFDSFDAGNWVLEDTGSNASFDGGYTNLGTDTSQFCRLSSSWYGGDIWSLPNSDWDVCMEVDIDQLTYVDSNSRLEIRLNERSGKGNALILEVWADGTIWAAVAATNDTETTIGPVSAPDTLTVRMARVGTTGYIWLWNESTEQWEWNGSTDGLSGTGIDLEIAVALTWNDSGTAANKVLGSINYFYLNSGTRVIH
jgi:hypothetical protein